MVALDLLEQLQAVPGVAKASVSSGIPLLGFGVSVANAFGGTYVAFITNYSGTNIIGAFFVTNSTGNPVFLGTLDTVPEITKVVVNTINNGASGYSYFSDLSPKETPLLKVSAAAGDVTVSWPSASTGYRLQQNPSLATTNWSYLAGTTNDNGTNKSILIHPATGNAFFVGGSSKGDFCASSK